MMRAAIIEPDIFSQITRLTDPKFLSDILKTIILVVALTRVFWYRHFELKMLQMIRNCILIFYSKQLQRYISVKQLGNK